VSRDDSIYEVLAEEHGQALDAIERLELTRDSGEQERLLGDVRFALEAHADCEAAVFYAALAAYEELDDLLEESGRDHERVASQLAALERMHGDREGWKRQLAALRETVEGHVLRDEETVFPAAQELLEEEDVAELAQRYLDQKRDYLG
jgi:hypothetical protein